jgi:hypothetical protein
LKFATTFVNDFFVGTLAFTPVAVSGTSATETGMCSVALPSAPVLGHANISVVWCV